MRESAIFFTLDFPRTSEPLEFGTKDQFEEWVDDEIRHWHWLWEDGSNPHTKNALNRLRNTLRQDEPLLQDMRQRSLEAFDLAQQHSIFRSDTEQGIRLLEMQKALGREIASIGFELERNSFSFGSTSNARRLRAAMAALTFDLDSTSRLGDRLKAERKNYRSAITRLENRVRQLESEKVDNDKRNRERRRRHMRKLFAIGRKNLKGESKKANSLLQSALASFAKTEDTYRKQMALLAPVKYWEDKAKTHGRWEIGYGLACIAYFVLAGFLIAKFATLAIEFLNSEQNASAYIIVAGALLGGTTLIFWVGRIIVKLFLSEHHLRSDCKEKAIMTQSFLSMAKDEEFSEDHRAIVLASIFRSTPDGIVREEGPGDVGVQALLAKALSKP